MFKFNSLCAVIALSAAPLVAAEELSETGEFLDGVAAIVNEGVVLKSQYYETLDLVKSQAVEAGYPLPPDDILKEQILERVVLTEIQLQRADRIGLQVTDAMLNDVLTGVVRRMDPDATLADLPEILARDGIKYPVFRRQMREEFTLEQLRRIEVGQIIVVSPREIEQCLADLEGNVVANSEYNLSHILLQLPESASAAEIDEIIATAQSIYERADDGADFRELAARHSESPTALEGGALGWMEGERVPTLFTEVLASLRAGDVSEPFRTATSIHIVKVNDMRGTIEQSEVNQVRPRHILISPNEIMDESTVEQRIRDTYDRIQGGEDFAELAKLLSDDPGSANGGGDLGWAGPGTFVPEFEATIDALEIGVVSEPFRTQFGWHIVEVLERRVYDNTDDLKERNCDGRIRASKMDEESQIWVRRLRDEAYVDIRM